VKRTLEEEGAVETGALRGKGFLDGCTIGGGVDGVVFGLDGLSGWHLFRLRDDKKTKEDASGGERRGWLDPPPYISRPLTPLAIARFVYSKREGQSQHSRADQTALKSRVSSNLRKNDHQSAAQSNGQLLKFARS
jgi:hypothetical protein